MKSRVLGTAVVLALLTITLAPAASRAAVGCSLNDPDRDIMRLFPSATSYVTDYIAISERGGESLAARVEAQLGNSLSGKFEALDVPYAYYTVFSDGKVLGRVHGVNQKGMFGGMQLILATDPEGTILDFYYQKLSSPEAKKFRSDGFTDQFTGLKLDDFLGKRGDGEPDRIAAIKDPSSESAEDFRATIRGIRKNLILLNEFMLRPATGAGSSGQGESKSEEDGR
jgi:hypothetical protein